MILARILKGILLRIVLLGSPLDRNPPHHVLLGHRSGFGYLLLSGHTMSTITDRIITGRRVDVTSCENIVEPVLENWSKRMEAKTSKTDCEQIRMCLKIGIQCLEFVKENRPSTKEILQILYTWEEINNGYASDKETYKLVRATQLGAEYSVVLSTNELSETAREETAEETAARVGGMVPAALDAVRAAARFPGRWKAIAANLEKLRACLQNPCSHHPCQLETYNNSLCREVLQSVADTLAEVTDLAGRCTEDLWKKVKPSTVDGVAVKLDVSLRDCELLVKIGELYEDTSSLPALDDTSTCVDVREVQRLLAWLEMSHTEAKILALDGLLEALHKDEKRVVSMLHIDNVSAMVQPLTASWPEVIRQKAATVVCHVAGSEDGWRLLESEVALPPLISLAKSYSQVSRQKAVVTLHHLSSASRSTARAIVSHCGVGPLTKMCSDKWCDPVSHSAAAGTLKNIFTAMDFRHSVDNHGIVGVMVDLLDRAEVAPESKEHAAECLKDFTSRDDDDGLRRAVVSEGGLRALLLYHLGDTDDRHETVVSAIRSLVGVISTTSGSADDATRRMKRLVGEQGCVPLLVRMIQEVGNSNSAREVAVEMLASLATYPLNATTMSEDDKCVPALVQLLVESAGSPICRHKAVVLLHIVSSKSHSSGWVIASLGGIDPLIQMCRHKRIDSMSQSAAAGTLKNISEVPDLRQSLAKHGIVSVMVDLLDCGDAVLASKDHAAECLMNLTSSRANDGGLQRDIVSEGGLRALLLYLGDTDQDRLQPHRVAVSAIRNLVGVISTTSGLADDDDTATTMKRVAGEQGCVPLLVRTMQDGASYTAREVAVHALASLATYPPNAREMDVDDKCVPALVQLLNLIPDSTITAIMDAVQCLLLLESTKRWRKLMISHGAKRYLKKLTDMDVQGATELLQRLERGSLRSLFSGSKQ
ncbi:hypothetical protein PR202_ga22502 [Eleusine coracana subsp. coracana]|uniref:DUF7032 domain-containing protein n=1 Tax=Eleusine coracana subsp. coracana TaxID=191504 RepID=A0AAV5D1W6_ELECO|nr:hypothetical protein PR202_ga22502 [Eleusine coracana subsp. coracana]